jgi:hypothetical protein
VGCGVESPLRVGHASRVTTQQQPCFFLFFFLYVFFLLFLSEMLTWQG